MQLVQGKNNIDKYRLLVLKQGLILEIKGMKRHGKSCYQIIKDEFNLKGNKQKVLDQFIEIINNL